MFSPANRELIPFWQALLQWAVPCDAHKAFRFHSVFFIMESLISEDINGLTTCEKNLSLPNFMDYFTNLQEGYLANRVTIGSLTSLFLHKIQSLRWQELQAIVT